jgi:hypothetical protein
MAKRHKFTTAQVIEALRSNRGLVSRAAQKLHCDVDTVQNYCKKFPTVEAAKQESRVSLLDLAESRLWEAIDRGEGWAVAFCLRTLGRSRGFGEKVDLSLSIQAAAQKVASEFGLTPEAVIAEAKQLLWEVEQDA